MRFEELTADDIRQMDPYYDTALMTMGGSNWRPAHLPVGTSWFILRRLRDMLEAAVGGRLITLPVVGIDVQGMENAIFQVSFAGAVGMLQHSVKELLDHMPLRHFLFLTDNLAAEQAFQEAVKDLAAQTPLTIKTFVWWRDGLKEQGDLQHRQSGEVETSLMFAIAKRLVDLEQKNAVKYGAQMASEQIGAAYFAELEHALMEKVQSLWSDKNF